MRSLLAALPVRGRLGGLVAAAVVAMALGCTSTPREGRRLDRSVITREQMLKGDYVTVYDAVAAMRSSWLRARGPDSFVLSSVVWVYIDGTRAGGVEVLRNIQPTLITTVRFYDGPTATGRWGVDNGSGVIHVSTWSEGAVGVPLPDSTRPVRPPAMPPSAKN